MSNVYKITITEPRVAYIEADSKAAAKSAADVQVAVERLTTSEIIAAMKAGVEIKSVVAQTGDQTLLLPADGDA